MPEAAGGATPYYASPSGDVVLYQGDALAVLRALPAGSVHAVITSPPFLGLRDYGIPPSEWPAVEYAPLPGLLSLTVSVPAMSCCLGLEPTVEAFVGHLVLVFRALRRVMRDDAAAFLNLGDSFAAGGNGARDPERWPKQSRNANGHRSEHSKKHLGTGVKAKDLLEIPSLVVLALRADGWWLRSRIPWIKRNSMPESADDRPSSSTEYVFLLSKASSYFYDAMAVQVGAIHAGRVVRASDPRTAQNAQHDMGNTTRLGFTKHDTTVGEGRNRRNADWWFDSLRAILDGATGLLADEDGAPLALPVNPAAYDKAHFATFPPKLVEPMLLASTSARGCCPACGAPWVRVASAPSGGAIGQSWHDHSADAETGNMKVVSSRGYAPPRTIGWRAVCACDAGDPVPCVCLDPFAGSGTVGVVARKHGRHFVGVDLSAAYLELARERLGQLAFDMGGAAWPTTSTSTDTPTGSASSATGDSPSPDGDGAASGSSTRPDGEARQAALDFDLAAGG